MSVHSSEFDYDYDPAKIAKQAAEREELLASLRGGPLPRRVQAGGMTMWAVQIPGFAPGYQCASCGVIKSLLSHPTSIDVLGAALAHDCLGSDPQEVYSRG